MMIKLFEKWAPILLNEAETGMGYQIDTIILNDKSVFKQVVISGGIIVRIRGPIGIPFGEDDVAEIIVTHDIWDFSTNKY